MTGRPKTVLTLLGLDAVVILAVVGQLALALGSPPTPELRVAEGTAAPESGLTVDASGRAGYPGAPAASMTIERHGDRVVTAFDPR